MLTWCLCRAGRCAVGHTRTRSAARSSVAQTAHTYAASIAHMRTLSPDVTEYTLDVRGQLPDYDDPRDCLRTAAGNMHTTAHDQHNFIPHVVGPVDITFTPGQWLDLYISTVPVVGGFSITSVPAELPRLQIAVKRTRHPPAAWLHGQAKTGDSLAVRVGGTFCYDIDRAVQPERGIRHLLFIAGGIGITPLLSIIRTYMLHPSAKRAVRATLLYSGKQWGSLAYADQLRAWAQQQPSAAGTGLHLQFALTGEHPGMPLQHAGTVQVQHGRLTQPVVQAALQASPVEATEAFICGPPHMTDTMVGYLQHSGLPEHAVHYEKWW